MIKLDMRDSRPIYEQIKEELKKLIIKGAMKTDEKIPSVRFLASSLSINPNTIQHAYRELEAEGYIYSRKATGYFVAPITEVVTGEKTDKLKKEMKDILKELKYLNVKKEDILSIVNEAMED
ncbi:MAG: GntR family transcriptional regulator [Clostridia bacterium]|nr:GntR family transcriptional regulator [Clostridia bacterium]